MAIFGTIGIFTRMIDVRSAELALYRAVLAVIVLLAYLAARRQSVDSESVRRWLPSLVVSGALLGFNWILLFEAYRYTTISMATLSYYFAPVIITVASPLLFHERLAGRQVLSFVMATIGLVLVIGPGGLAAGTGEIRGILYGLGAAVLYATLVLLNKRIGMEDGIQRTLVQLIAVIVVLLPYVLATGGTDLGGFDAAGWACLLTVGIVHTGIAYCLYFSALHDVSGQEAAILSYVDPLVAIVLSVTLLGEPMSALQALGGLLILGFTLVNELPSKA